MYFFENFSGNSFGSFFFEKTKKKDTKIIIRIFKYTKVLNKRGNIQIFYRRIIKIV